MPSSAICVATIGTSIASASRIFSRVPPPSRIGQQIHLRAFHVRPHIVDESSHGDARVARGQVERPVCGGLAPTMVSRASGMAFEQTRARPNPTISNTASRFGNQFMPLTMIRCPRSISTRGAPALEVVDVDAVGEHGRRGARDKSPCSRSPSSVDTTRLVSNSPATAASYCAQLAALHPEVEPLAARSSRRADVVPAGETRCCDD